MGCWGSGIYQNDTADDVKSDFYEELRKGRTVEEITKQMIEEIDAYNILDWEVVSFWLALADQQWKRGVLQDEVKKMALDMIENHADIAPTEQIYGTFSEKKRKNTLMQLKEQLLSPQPPMKLPKVPKLYKCEWQIGDVFSYRLECDLAKERGLYGRHLLFQKIDEETWYPGHIIPVVYAKITKDETLPQTAEEYEALEYIQIRHLVCRVDPRHTDLLATEEQLRELRQDKGWNVYDQKFRFGILNTSKRVIPKKLLYLGNFQNITPPKYEHLPAKISLDAFYWKQRDVTLEKIIVECYIEYTLKECYIFGWEST